MSQPDREQNLDTQRSFAGAVRDLGDRHLPWANKDVLTLLDRIGDKGPDIIRRIVTNGKIPVGIAIQDDPGLDGRLQVLAVFDKGGIAPGGFRPEAAKPIAVLRAEDTVIVVDQIASVLSQAKLINDNQRPLLQDKAKWLRDSFSVLEGDAVINTESPKAQVAEDPTHPSQAIQKEVVNTQPPQKKDGNSKLGHSESMSAPQGVPGLFGRIDEIRAYLEDTNHRRALEKIERSKQIEQAQFGKAVIDLGRTVDLTKQMRNDENIMRSLEMAAKARYKRKFDDLTLAEQGVIVAEESGRIKATAEVMQIVETGAIRRAEEDAKTRGALDVAKSLQIINKELTPEALAAAREGARREKELLDIFREHLDTQGRAEILRHYAKVQERVLVPAGKAINLVLLPFEIVGMGAVLFAERYGKILDTYTPPVVGLSVGLAIAYFKFTTNGLAGDAVITLIGGGLTAGGWRLVKRFVLKK